MRNEAEEQEWMEIIAFFMYALGIALVAVYGHFHVAVGVFLIIWAENVRQKILLEKMGLNDWWKHEN